MIRFRQMIWVYYAAPFLLLWLFTSPVPVHAAVIERCPGQGIQARPAEFEPGGIILTSFDGANLWVYDIDGITRYPLPDTRPCPGNCHLSPDGTWLTMMNPITSGFMKMRVDGTERTPLFGAAADVAWWDSTTFLVWTPDHHAYLTTENAPLDSQEYLDARAAVSVQPGGRWAVVLEQQADGSFARVMLDMTQRDNPDAMRARLATDTPYFNAQAWSPDGRWLAYVGRGAFNETKQVAGAELFLIQPGNPLPQQVSFFALDYGAARIGGYAADRLSWSPDNTKIAFWLIPLLGPDPEGNTGNAVLHMLDLNTREIVRYCTFSTTQHVPNPPEIIWSPDSTTIAFAGDVPQDGKGALILAVDAATGLTTELSDGIYPALGTPELVAWGRRP